MTVVEISNVRRVLSFDGGGVRGLVSLLILRDLMDSVVQNHKPSAGSQGKNPKVLLPCEYFDLICGTSTGGLIAIMLGCLGMVILRYKLETNP